MGSLCKFHAMKKALLGVMLLCFCYFSSGAAERMTVAVLNPQNESGDTNAAFWQYGISALINEQLSEVKSCRLLPESSIVYAFRQLEVKAGQPINPDEARKLGETIEARRVVWSEYSLKGKQCSLTVRVINVATGKVSRQLSSSGPDWFQVVSNSVNLVLHELAVIPAPDEEARMNHPPTRSSEALELCARAVAMNREHRPFSEMQPLLQSAASIDPSFPMPLYAQAIVLLTGQGKADEAEDAAEQAVSLRPDYAVSHNVLGLIYEFKGMNYSAMDELREAVRLDPDDPDNFDRLGEIYARMERFADAIAAYKEAALLAPYDAKPQAHLGEAYALQGNRDQALEALRLAERLNPGDDVENEEGLSDAYLQLKDVPHYVEHTENFLSAAKKLGAEVQMVGDAETNLAYWKGTLTPHFISAPAPRDYSREELDKAIKARLTPAECLSVTNPLGSTAAMKKWAEELTAGATGEEPRSRRLFEGLTHHLDRGNFSGYRTAEQVFGIWNETNVDLTCMDYALLYVTLARDAGLRAYFTLVKRDYSGSPVLHVCACVFIGGKGLLVDPAYDWFGAPHQEYELQDDFQVTGDFLSQLPDLRSRRLAVKLRPEFAIGHFNLAMILAGTNQPAEARKELAAGLALDSTSPISLMARGAMEANEQNLDAAAQHLQQCLDLDPGIDDARFSLGRVLYAQHKFPEAREQFRKYLQGLTEPEKADFASKAIAQVNENEADPASQAPPESPPGSEVK
jgi:tetratricopeptide (TPR) repeat protein